MLSVASTLSTTKTRVRAHLVFIMAGKFSLFMLHVSEVATKVRLGSDKKLLARFRQY